MSLLVNSKVKLVLSTLLTMIGCFLMLTSTESEPLYMIIFYLIFIILGSSGLTHLFLSQKYKNKPTR